MINVAICFEFPSDYRLIRVSLPHYLLVLEQNKVPKKKAANVAA